MSKLGALEADIQAVTQRLARISSDAPPALPVSLQQAMALANSRKRKSCEVVPSSQLVGAPDAKRGHSLDNSRSGALLCTSSGSHVSLDALLGHCPASLCFKPRRHWFCTSGS